MALYEMKDDCFEPISGSSFTQLHKTLNSPNHSIRKRLDRLTIASPDLLDVIKQEGRV